MTSRMLAVIASAALLLALAPAAASAAGARLVFPANAARTTRELRPSVFFHVVSAGNVSASRLAAAEDAIVLQVNTQVRPHWKTPVIAFGSAGIPVYIEPASEVSGICDAPVTGCHSLDPNGAAIYVLQLDPALQQDWNELTVVLSHEIIEALTDPKQTPVSTTSGPLLPEACDPVEDDRYYIGNITVSNFVYPRWFVGGSSGPWDQNGIVSAALRADLSGALPPY